MSDTNADFRREAQDLLDQFYAEFPDEDLARRAAVALRYIASSDTPIKGAARGWAGGIVYALGKPRGSNAGIPNVSGADLKRIFKADDGTITGRANDVCRELSVFRDAPLFPRWPSSSQMAAAWLAYQPEEKRAELGLVCPGGFTRRDEANALVLQAFRLGPLERIHGEHVAVFLEREVLPHITDDKLKEAMLLTCQYLAKRTDRITQDEIKEIMLNACQCMEWLLYLREDDPNKYFNDVSELVKRCHEWDRSETKTDPRKSQPSPKSSETQG